MARIRRCADYVVFEIFFVAIFQKYVKFYLVGFLLFLELLEKEKVNKIIGVFELPEH